MEDDSCKNTIITRNGKKQIFTVNVMKFRLDSIISNIVVFIVFAASSSLCKQQQHEIQQQQPSLWRHVQI